MRSVRSLHLLRAFAWLALLAAAPWPAAAAPADEPGATAPAPTAAAESTSEVRGDIPREAVGHWLVVLRLHPMTYEAGGEKANAERGEGEARFLELSQSGSGEWPTIRTWELSGEGEKLALALHRQELPEELKRKIAPPPEPAGERRGAGATAGPGAGDRAAAPDARTLAEVDRLWPGLAGAGTEGASVASRVFTYDAASEQDRFRLGATRARLFILTDERIPEAKKGGGVVQSVTVYAVDDVAADRLGGRVQNVMVLPARHTGAFAIPPVPVSLEGDFVAYRVPEAAAAAGSQPAPASLLERLLAVFSGCGAR